MRADGAMVWPVGSASFPMYWMSASRFWHWGPGHAHYPGGSEMAPGSYDQALAFSRDGEHFEFVGARQGWIRPGREGSVGSRRQWLAAPGAVRVGDDELYFVTRSNVCEGPAVTIDPASDSWESDIAIGRTRVNGLVSLDAPYLREADAAVLVTKPLIFRGHKLFLNLDSAGPGSLAIEVRRADQPSSAPAELQSVPLSANGVNLLVMWGGTPESAGSSTMIEKLSGVPVVLTLRMQACSLFGLRFGD